jgi:hypothetical protein
MGRGGLWVLSERLERGTFAWPKPGDGIGGKLPLRAEALSLLMDGIDLRVPWYERDQTLRAFVAYT